MNIKLPRRIDKRITEEYGAYLAPNRGKERVLYVPQAMFEKTMYALTYQMKGDDICYYCGNPLTSSTRSLDHLYPRDYGGISVPNNLVPCCKDCNGKKNNFTEEEYYRFKAVKYDYELKKAFLEEISKKHEEIRRKEGIILPREWYTLQRDYNVLVQINSTDSYKKSNQYIRVTELYETYGRICKPVVITSNHVVVDGFLALMLAKNLPNKVKVPFITLENVIAI